MSQNICRKIEHYKYKLVHIVSSKNSTYENMSLNKGDMEVCGLDLAIRRFMEAVLGTGKSKI